MIDFVNNPRQRARLAERVRFLMKHRAEVEAVLEEIIEGNAQGREPIDGIRPEVASAIRVAGLIEVLDRHGEKGTLLGAILLERATLAKITEAAETAEDDRPETDANTDPYAIGSKNPMRFDDFRRHE